jgi:hypothetical protein
MPSIDGDTARGLRDRRLGKVLFLVALLVAAFLIARGCASRAIEIDQNQAMAIAREAVDFEANYTLVRAQRRGLKSRYYWLVGVADRRPDGTYAKCVNVLVDAKTGEVTETRAC